MNCISDHARRRLLAATLALPAAWASQRVVAMEHGVAGKVSEFDAAVWARLLQSGPRPAAYVFTTTYCSTCPAVFELLHRAIAASRQHVELMAVVMNAQGERALAHAHHYIGATRVYAFSGFEPEIRYAVDPKWRNITPYVALLGRKGVDQRVIGPPDAAQLQRWLA